ncbi:MAG: type II toxin-antitoxin system VapC family toxin [Bauldia sp.]|nr:type II toxin-antitoxin system VapC family toxin [Bauldia sp.]
MIVLDTNVLSEMMTPRPSPTVTAWLASFRPSDLWTSAITRAELIFGVRSMPDGRRRGEIARGMTTMFTLLEGRFLPFAEDACEPFAEIVLNRRRMGRPIPTPDAQIAAIARAAGMAVATRDVKDFADCGIDIINPWSAA